MNEVIENVLSNEAYTTNEERAEALRQGLATLVIPKDKYNDLSTKLKNTETSLSTLQTEYDDFKKATMTEEELRESERKKLETEKKANAIERSSLAVQKLLLNNGIEVKEEDIELKETLETIVSEDYDKSIKLANSFISLLNKTKTSTAQETITQLLNDTPKPTVSNPNSGTVSNLDSYKQKYDEAVKNGDFLAQTQYMRLMQEEQMKQNKPSV